jgi:threonine/homoserine/homoserine lactone efflux protein
VTLAGMLGLSAVFMLMTFVVFVIYGLLAARVRDHVIPRPRVLTWMRRTSSRRLWCWVSSWRWRIARISH